MKIIFLADTELEIVENYNEQDDVVESSQEIFRKGAVHEVDMLYKDEVYMDVQFGDGSCCFGIPLSLVNISD
jgi:hypothetical protein